MIFDGCRGSVVWIDDILPAVDVVNDDESLESCDKDVDDTDDEDDEELVWLG